MYALDFSRVVLDTLQHSDTYVDIIYVGHDHAVEYNLSLPEYDASVFVGFSAEIHDAEAGRYSLRVHDVVLTINEATGLYEANATSIHELPEHEQDKLKNTIARSLRSVYDIEWDLDDYLESMYDYE